METSEDHKDRSNDAKSEESVCSPCQLELNNKKNEKNLERDDEIEGDLLNNLMEASKSFSQISINAEESLDFDVSEETLFFLENEENLRKNKNLSSDYPSKISSSDMNQKDVVKTSFEEKECPTLTIEKEVSAGNSDFCLRLSSLTGDKTPRKLTPTPQESTSTGAQSPSPDNPPTKRLKLIPKRTFCEKSVQTDSPVGLKNCGNSGASTTTELHNGGDRAPEVLQSKSNEIAASAVRRKRRLQDLTNNIYEASCYLDEIRMALAASNSESTPIPPPPKLNGYESQFDFPERSRFSKLPITIENMGSGKGSGLKDNSALKLHSNSSPNVGKGPKKSSVTTSAFSKPSTTKSISNKVEISLPSRFKKQQSIRQMFLDANKENKNAKDTQDKYKISSITSVPTNVSNKKDTISDSGSMYDYNPYARSRKTLN